MICTAYFGELNDVRKNNWKNDDKNPYAVLNMPIILERKGQALLYEGDRYFHDKIQIDWGSFVWKCTKKQLEMFQEKEKVEIPGLTKLSEGTNYGVVFIEMS